MAAATNAEAVERLNVLGPPPVPTMFTVVWADGSGCGLRARSDRSMAATDAPSGMRVESVHTNASASPGTSSRAPRRSQKSPQSSSETGYRRLTRASRTSFSGFLVGMRSRARLVDELADRVDGAEALRPERGVVDGDVELRLEPRDDREQAEAVHDPAGQQVVVRVELLHRDVRHELLDDELLDLGCVIHWPAPSLWWDRKACGRSSPSMSSA